MTSIPFDTLKMMERLESAGFTNAQARVQIEVLAEVKSELIRWVVSVGVLQTALIAALLLKLTH